jgi:AraC-like DNA-binding protein
MAIVLPVRACLSGAGMSRRAMMDVARIARTSTDAMVAPVVLSLVLAEAERQQVSPRPLLRGLNIDKADLESPSSMVPRRAALTAVRRAMPLLALGDRGLELGTATRITERGLLALGQLAAPTLGDAIRLALRYPQIAGYLVHIYEEVAGDVTRLIAEPFLGDQDVQDFLIDLTFAAKIVSRQQMTATPCRPSAVELVRSAPAHSAAYEDFFGCPVRFGCLRNAISAPAEQLRMTLPWANQMAYGLSSRLLKREFGQVDRLSTLGHAVERAVRRCLPRTATLAEVAELLHVSERTLRRRLVEAGLSYSSLVDDIRKSRALDLMASGHRPVAQVSEQVGFAHARAFARAFKRWTGQTPTSVKDRNAALPTASGSRVDG